MEPEGSLHCSQEPATVPVQGQMNPVDNFSPYFAKIHSNIIFPSVPRSSEWTLPFRLQLSHACYLPLTSESPHYAVFPSLPPLPPFTSKYSPQHLILKLSKSLHSYWCKIIPPSLWIA